MPDTDIEGAKAAAEGIWAAYFGGLIHGSTVNLEALSDTNCEFCKKSIAEIQYYESQGVRLDPSFTWNIEELLATGPAPDDDHHLVMLKFSYNPMKMVDSQGAVVSEGDAGVLYAGVRERLTPDGWSVAEVGDFSEEEYLGTRSQIFGDTP